jgi:hypothetical protein
LGLAALSAPARPAASQEATGTRTSTARITYLTGGTAYLDAGRLDGLREATRVEVVRGRAIVGVLKVAFLGSHRASCDIVSTTAVLVVGDSVRFVPVAEPKDSSLATRNAYVSPPLRAGIRRLRGRVGAQYFVMRQRDGTAGGLSQPAIDLMLAGHPFGAPALEVALDMRTRRTRTTLSDGSAVTDDRNRVYQAALTFNAPGSPTRLTIGRQLSGNLASVGLFDGALAERQTPAWTLGMFTGSQPEPLRLGFSSAVVEGGGYIQRHSRPGTPAPWAVTFGVSGSYQDVHANREFAFLGGSYLGRRLTAFLTQEVDYYRWWKLLPGMRAISPTSTFALVQWRVTDGVTLDGGFDNRRNVRLYRDAVNPETVFDDTFRQGAWAGVWLQLSRRYRLGFDARSSGGGPAGNANAYTVSFGADRLTRFGGTLRTRSTYYTNPQSRGWLESAAVAFAPGERLRLNMNAGLRAVRDPLADPSHVLVTWVGADLDVTLARAWYGMLSATRQRGGVDGNDQIYGGVSFRF